MRPACLLAMKPEHCAHVGAIILVAEAAFAVTQLATGGFYHSFIRPYGHVLDAALAVIWLAGAASLWFGHFAGAGFLSELAALVSLIHGLFFALAAPRTALGLPFIVAGVVVAACAQVSRRRWGSVLGGSHPRYVGH
jgi:hypothetical protein